jgi:hypothetical protein
MPKARPTACETGQTNKANPRSPRHARRASGDIYQMDSLT